MKKIACVVAVLLSLIVVASGSPSEAYLKARVVKLTSDKGSCSGEQVRAPSGQDYILTAAHCAGLAENGSIKAITEDGKELMRRIVAEDPQSDLLLLEGLPNLRGLSVASYSMRGQHVRTLTHGAGMDTYRTEGVLIMDKHLQVLLDVLTDDASAAACRMPKHLILDVDSMFGPVKVCLLSIEETMTTAMIVPGSSGGVVIDDRGRLVGVVSAGDAHFGALVTLRHIRSFLRSY